MSEEKKPEIETLQLPDAPEKTEAAKDAVISGANKTEHQSMFLDARAEGNQDSPSDLSLKALNPDDPQYAVIASNRFEIVDDSPKTPERPIPSRPAEKLHPRDGMTVSFHDLLKNYSTPFLDAYLKSKSLADNQPGKSKTLEQVIDRMKTCPWADQIQVRFDSKVHNPDYNGVNSTITINPDDLPYRQIEVFAHEGFHATHQDLKLLYLGEPVTDKDTYVRIKSKHEIEAFISEIHVHDELTKNMPGAKPVSYEWKNSWNINQPDADLSRLLKERGRDGLTAFLMDEAKARMKIGDEFKPATYREYFSKGHAQYLSGFQKTASKLTEWFTSAPGVKSRIESGGY